MALLGNLRQGKVGSWFATSSAICLHEGAPEAVAKDLKTLLETNKLVFDRNGAKFDMPRLDRKTLVFYVKDIRFGVPYRVEAPWPAGAGGAVRLSLLPLQE